MINEQFKKAWNITVNKFNPTHCEWLAWLGQPNLYDGGLCVNRTVEEHRVSNEHKGSLIL